MKNRVKFKYTAAQIERRMNCFGALEELGNVICELAQAGLKGGADVEMRIAPGLYIEMCYQKAENGVCAFNGKPFEKPEQMKISFRVTDTFRKRLCKP